MLKQDAELPYSYVPLDALVLAPLGALLLGLIAAPLVALRLIATGIYETPTAIVKAVESVMRTRQLGVLGKMILVPLSVVLPILLLVLSPVWGLVAGFLHGAANGWMFVSMRTKVDIFKWPTERLEAAYHSIATCVHHWGSTLRAQPHP